MTPELISKGLVGKPLMSPTSSLPPKPASMMHYDVPDSPKGEEEPAGAAGASAIYEEIEDDVSLKTGKAVYEQLIHFL